MPIWAWLVFAAIVLVSIAADLFGHRGERGGGTQGALAWSIGWIVVALVFGGWVWSQFGRTAGEDFLAAYLVEKSLSLDNLFVFLVVFTRLRIPSSEQHRVLFWGILGAFATRALFIAAGVSLLQAWHNVVYVLGAFLVFTGVRTARERSDEKEGEGKVLGFLRRHVPFTPTLSGHHFVVIENGRRLATPLLLALLVVEITDVFFAVDSIPAVFAITSDPFIVYTSNVFAILGLRALYLVLASQLTGLKYLRYGLAAILVFAGLKMLASDVVHVPHLASLATIVGILVLAIVPSVVSRRRDARRAA
jgi:tellurite resistance protein TerC